MGPQAGWMFSHNSTAALMSLVCLSWRTTPAKHSRTVFQGIAVVRHTVCWTSEMFTYKTKYQYWMPTTCIFFQQLQGTKPLMAHKALREYPHSRGGSRALRDPRALQVLPSPPGLLHLPTAQDPTSAPEAISPCPSDAQQAWAPAPHSPAQPPAPPSQGHPWTQCPVPGLPQLPSSPAGVVGWSLATGPCPESPHGEPLVHVAPVVPTAQRSLRLPQQGRHIPGEGGKKFHGSCEICSKGGPHPSQFLRACLADPGRWQRALSCSCLRTWSCLSWVTTRKLSSHFKQRVTTLSDSVAI